MMSCGCKCDFSVHSLCQFAFFCIKFYIQLKRLWVNLTKYAYFIALYLKFFSNFYGILLMRAKNSLIENEQMHSGLSSISQTTIDLNKKAFKHNECKMRMIQFKSTVAYVYF